MENYKIKFFLLAEDYSEPEANSQMYSQIGPPRNLTVEKTPDGFLVQWEEPEYGMHGISFYIIRFVSFYTFRSEETSLTLIFRWFLEPEHKLHGQAETRNTNYTGKVFLIKK